jgi:septal ring-binding cell division protein DamX
MCNLDARNSACVTNTRGYETSSRASPSVNDPIEPVNQAQPLKTTVTKPAPVDQDPIVATSSPAPEPKPEFILPISESTPTIEVVTSLNDAPTGTFVLQIAAMQEESSALSFIIDRQLDNAQIYAVDSGGNRAHAVVVGYFQSKEDGVDAAEAFGNSYPGFTPWVRRVEEMRAA